MSSINISSLVIITFHYLWDTIQHASINIFSSLVNITFHYYGTLSSMPASIFRLRSTLHSTIMGHVQLYSSMPASTLISSSSYRNCAVITSIFSLYDLFYWSTFWYHNLIHFMDPSFNCFWSSMEGSTMHSLPDGRYPACQLPISLSTLFSMGPSWCLYCGFLNCTFFTLCLSGCKCTEKLRAPH